MKKKATAALFLCVIWALLTGCAESPRQEPADTAPVSSESNSSAIQREPEPSVPSEIQHEPESSALSEEAVQVQTGIIPEQILDGETGEIHYSCYLPENYDESTEYPLMMVMPGYDMMWFGEESSGSNLNWRGFLCWTELPEDMIVVSAQLTDWHETSAKQAIELTEYFLDHFSVDESRVYAAGYSAGGETMSQAVSMRPDLYAAYLHGASQWDGEYTPIAENDVAVYIFMAENDEYYGSERARDAYQGLYDAYESTGWTQDEISAVLQIQTPDNEWFAERNITGNYHGGGNVVFEETSILEWIVSHSKEGEMQQ